MQKPFLCIILATVILASYVSVTDLVTMQSATGPMSLDFPPIKTADAAVDMFLKLGDIKGESTDRAHSNEIDVLSWSWGMSQSGVAGKVNVQDLSFTKYLDKSSPELFLACANGKHYPEAKLTVRKAGDKPLEYLKITLKDVLVSSYSVSGGGSEEIPTENVTLNFSKVEIEYTEQKADGTIGETVVAGWDVAANRSTSGEGSVQSTPVKAKIVPSEAGSTVFEVEAEGRTFNVTVIGEGITSLSFSMDQRAIAMESDGTEGSIEVEIPKELLGGTFTIMADDEEIEFEMTDTETSSVLLLDNPADTKMVTVQGTTVVPEFPLAMILLPAMIGISMAIFYAMKRNRTYQKPFLAIIAIISIVGLLGYVGTTAVGDKNMLHGALETISMNTFSMKNAEAAPAVDMFLKLGDIKGESTDRAHSNEIDVLSWSWGVTRTGAISGASTGQAVFQDYNFTKYIDKSSPKLMLAAASGEHIGEALLTVRNPAGHEYFQITLTDVLISSYSSGGSGGEDRLTENITLNFSKIQMEYKEQKADGTMGETVKAGWDVKKNIKV